VRIVFVNRIGWPDEGATAIYLTDVAEALAADGHEVHVVCGEAPYRTVSGAPSRPPSVHRGVRYHRIRGRRGGGTLDRVLASAAFLARVALRLVRLRRPDVVVGLTDPPYVDALAGLIARRHGARTIHWVMDLYPDIAVAAGVLRRGSWVERTLGAVMGGALRRATGVVVLGQRMRRPILARGVSRRRLHVIGNWAPGEVEECALRPRPRPAGRPFTLMYAGTYGLAHDLEPLFERLRRVGAGSGVRLILQVSGARLSELHVAATHLPVTLEWRPPSPLAGLADALREADLHVASIRQGFERLVVPSKMYAPLALGIPVLLVRGRQLLLSEVSGSGADATLRWTPVPEPGAASDRDALFTVDRAAPVPPLCLRRAGLAAWASVLTTRRGAGRRCGDVPG